MRVFHVRLPFGQLGSAYAGATVNAIRKKAVYCPVALAVLEQGEIARLASASTAAPSVESGCAGARAGSTSAGMLRTVFARRSPRSPQRRSPPAADAAMGAPGPR